MTQEIALVFAVLAVIIFLFVSEWLRVDVVALFVMLAHSGVPPALPGRQ